MKTKSILFISIVLIFLSLGVGCEKEKVIEDFSHLKCAPLLKIGAKDDIIGKWKLVQIWKMVGAEGNSAVFDTIDVSCNNVYYEFKTDNILKITGNEDDFPAGSYTYSYQPANICPTCLPAPNLIIGDYEPIFCLVYEYKIIMTLKGRLFLRTK